MELLEISFKALSSENLSWYLIFLDWSKDGINPLSLEGMLLVINTNALISGSKEKELSLSNSQVIKILVLIKNTLSLSMIKVLKEESLWECSILNIAL